MSDHLPIPVSGCDSAIFSLIQVFPSLFGKLENGNGLMSPVPYFMQYTITVNVLPVDISCGSIHYHAKFEQKVNRK